MNSNELINKTRELLKNTEVEINGVSFQGMPLRKDHEFYKDDETGEMIDLDEDIFNPTTNYEDFMNIRDEYKVSDIYVEDEGLICFKIEKMELGEETNISEEFAKMTDGLDEIYNETNIHFELDD